MTRPSTRLRAAVLLTAIATAGLTGCGSSGKHAGTATLSGSCAMNQQYARVSPITHKELGKLFGKGTYVVEGNLRAGSSGVPEAGECSYALASKPTDLLIQVGLNRQTDLFTSTAQARALQKKAGSSPIPGLDGFIVPDPGTGAGSGDHGPLAVVFDGTQTVTVHVVSATTKPTGAALTKHLGDIAKHATKYLSKPMK